MNATRERRMSLGGQIVINGELCVAFNKGK